MKHKVIDNLTGIIVFKGLLNECKEFINTHDNGFLTLYP